MSCARDSLHLLPLPCRHCFVNMGSAQTQKYNSVEILTSCILSVHLKCELNNTNRGGAECNKAVVPRLLLRLSSEPEKKQGEIEY